MTRGEIRHHAGRDIHRHDARVFVLLGSGATIVQRLLRRHAVRDDVFAVRLPLWAAAETAVRRDLLEARAVGVDDIQVAQLKVLPTSLGKRQVAQSVGRKRDPLPVG